LTDVSGNQRLRPNYQSNKPQGGLCSPVSVQEMGEFLSLEVGVGDAQLISAYLQAATQACLDYTNIEMLERQWVLKMDRNPERQAGYLGVGLMHAYAAWWVQLPVYPVQSIDSVKVAGESVTARSIDLDSRPARVEVDESGAIEITYTAGHASIQDINPQLLLGIKMLAGYLYDHRGACDVGEAVKASGAAMMWGNSRMVITL
jgi:uncharacterized phiE125 gp8 family phage protein